MAHDLCKVARDDYTLLSVGAGVSAAEAMSLMMRYRNGAVSDLGDDDESSDDDDGNHDTSTHPQDEHIPAGTQCIITNKFGGCGD